MTFNNLFNLVRLETNQSAAIQGNNYGDFPMTTFQSASETLPIPNSNTSNKINRKNKKYIKIINKNTNHNYNVLSLNNCDANEQTRMSSHRRKSKFNQKLIQTIVPQLGCWFAAIQIPFQSRNSTTLDTRKHITRKWLWKSDISFFCFRICKCNWDIPMKHIGPIAQNA